MRQAATIDVEGFEDLVNVIHRDVPVFGPKDDLQVFLADFQTIEDAVEYGKHSVSPGAAS